MSGSKSDVPLSRIDTIPLSDLNNNDNMGGVLIDPRDLVKQGSSTSGEPHSHLAQDAKNATDKEQAMTLAQGLRLYPKAILWSIVISTCIAMEGYDLCLLGNFCESRDEDIWTNIARVADRLRLPQTGSLNSIANSVISPRTARTKFLLPGRLG